MSASSFIPFHRASVGQEEIDAVSEVLRSQWLTTGPKAHQLEKDFAEYVGARYAVAVNSCTAALQLAIDAIDLRPGDEVIVPAYTFTATAATVIHSGAVPVLCDSKPGEFNLDPESVASLISPRTRAILPVHIAGLPCDLEAVHDIAEQNELHVIEDAAHALPASFQGRKIGSVSELTAFSFYATKTITSGEGGMLTTDNEAYARRARCMRLHGISGDAWKRYSREGSWFYEVEDAGFKSNLCDILAAIALAQLKKCERFAEQRRAIAQAYIRGFDGEEGLEMPPESDRDHESAWHLFILRLRPEELEISRDKFISELKSLGIGTSVHFIPLHLHPYYAERWGYRAGDFPNAEDAYSRALSLPLFPDMDRETIDRVISSVISLVRTYRKSQCFIHG